MKKQINKINKNKKGIFSILVVLVLAFTGCEAGLTTSNGSTDSEGNETSGFSFSDLYNSIANLQDDVGDLQTADSSQENDMNSEFTNLRNDMGAADTALETRLTGSDTKLQSNITVLDTKLSGSDKTLQSDITTLQNQVNKFSTDVSTELANQLAFYKSTSAPVGSIVAWHKNLETVSIPAGWVECNGQKIADEGSVYYEKYIPNLNGETRFLRGGSSSGTLQEDTTAVNGLSVDSGGSHKHTYKDYYAKVLDKLIDETNDYDKNRYGSTSVSRTSDSAGSHNHSLSGDDETRPVNMSVVWIMRVK